MAGPLDLEEQEQLDALKSFWKQYGNLITWVLILALGSFAAWNGWTWWQREQGAKAAAMFDELDRAAQGGDVDKAARAFADLKERYARTAYAQQAGLLAAKVQIEKGHSDAARASLAWVADNAVEDEYRSVARLRLAALQLDARQFDDALKTLDAATAPAFAALVADRRGDVLLAMGRRDEARAAYDKAWKGLPATVDYRRLIEAKLTALGAPPANTESAAQAASAPGGAK
jgi:predicted negative regulator of RcsB-dependent stress response